MKLNTLSIGLTTTDAANLDGVENGRAQKRPAAHRPLSRKLIHKLLGVMWPYRWMYGTGLLCGLLMAGCELIGPRVAQQIVDQGIPSGMAGPILLLGGLWGAVMLASLLLESLQIGLTHRAGESVVRDLRVRMFSHLQRLGMSFFDRHKLGEIVTRPTSDLEAVRETVVSGLNTMVANLLLSSGAAVMLMTTDFVLFVSIAWLIPLVIFLNAKFRRLLGEQHFIVRAGFARLAAYLAENIAGHRIVAAFNRQDLNLMQFNQLQRENTLNNMRAAHLNGLYQPALETVRLVGQLILLGYGATQVLSGRLTPGAVVAAFFYWDLFMRPTITLGTFYNTAMASMASAERIFDLLDTEPDVHDKPGAVTLPKLAREIRLEHVTFGYDSNHVVLRDVNLTIPVGKTFALVGATGSGKTTILALLTRMYECGQGSVRFDGVDIRDATLHSLREQIGIVLQTNYLFSGTILDNVRYGRPEASDEQVYEAARALGVHDLFLAQLQGYHTEVGERGASVSLGVRQLICFTRVLLADPPIFLLDEATSAVDTGTEEILRQALKKLTAERTTIIVAHRLSTITDADQIVVLDRGAIVEQGTNLELLFQGGVYANLYAKFLAAHA